MCVESRLEKNGMRMPDINETAANAAREAVNGALSIWGIQDKHSGWADDAIQWAKDNKLATLAGRNLS